MDLSRLEDVSIYIVIFYLERILPITGLIGLTTKRGEEIKSNQQQRISSAMCMALLHPAASCEWGRRRMAGKRSVNTVMRSTLALVKQCDTREAAAPKDPSMHTSSCQFGSWCVVGGWLWRALSLKQSTRKRLGAQL